MDKKKTATGAAALAVAAAITVGINTSETQELYGSYSISTQDGYKSTINITVPKEFTPDICTLYFNGLEVDKALMPNGEFDVYPVIAQAPERFTIDCNVLGKKVGTASFTVDGQLVFEVEKKYLKEAD
ncbi:MAG: hypothetical protein IJ300_06985 [Clostridia bacterium]|nr:hypothetical protein [Clostridia bacterium]